MHQIECHYSKPQDYRLCTGSRLVVGPGVIRGKLSLSRFDNPTYSTIRGITQVHFDCADSDGNCRRYQALIHPGRFLPRDAREVVIAEAPKRWDYAFMASLDDRERIQLRTSGPPIELVTKYLGITAKCVIEVDQVLAWITCNSDDDRARSGLLTFMYSIPVGDLLWRKAPLMCPGDMQCEAKDCVSLELHEHMASLEASNLTVLDD